MSFFYIALKKNKHIHRKVEIKGYLSTSEYYLFVRKLKFCQVIGQKAFLGWLSNGIGSI